jgi:cardiolipin synthase (CMP-forming)
VRAPQHVWPRRRVACKDNVMTIQRIGSPASRINWPNIITMARVIAVPAVAVLALQGGAVADWWALAIFAAAAASDYLDGWLARLWNQGSEFGRMLDPIADKLLVGVVLLVLVAKGTIAGPSLWAAIIILSREILVSGLREYLAGLNVKVLVTRLAKWKTALQLVALGALLAEPALPGLTTVGLVLLWASALLTGYTGFAYLQAALRHTNGAKE